MIIRRGDSDTEFLLTLKARSRNAVFIYMGNRKENSQIINRPIVVVTRILKMVVASAVELEVDALYHNTIEIIPISVPADVLGHTQPVTPLQTDNSMATGIMNESSKQRRSKAIYMRFCLMKDKGSTTKIQSVLGTGAS